MRKTSYYTLSLISIFFFYKTAAQTTGSGTISLNTPTDTSIQVILINAQAEKITGSGSGTTYDVEGDTNSPIDFFDWLTENALGIEEYVQGEHYTVFGNPGPELDIIIKNEKFRDFSGRIYNMLGQEVAIPQIINNHDTVELYSDLSHLNVGAYFVKITDGDSAFSFKFLKNDSSNTRGPQGQNFSNFFSQKNSNNTAQSKSTNGEHNYNITWDEIDLPGNSKINTGSQTIEVLISEENEINIDMDLYENPTGDIALFLYLNGIPQSNSTITMTNVDFPANTYTINTGAEAYGIFENIHVQNAGPVEYEVTVEDNNSDDTYITTITTIDMFQDEDFEINGTQTIDLTSITNEQDLTVVNYNYLTLNKTSGLTVELRKASDDSLIDSEVSDGNGNVTFDDVPGNIEVYLVNYKTGNYKKTNKSFLIPLVDHVSEMTDTINMTNIPKFNLADGSPVTAALLELYKPIADHTELALGHWRVYFPSDPNQSQYINRFSYVVHDLLERPSSFIAETSAPFAVPYIGGYLHDDYYPYPDGRNVFEGEIGTNITNYGGTATGRGIKILQNGNEITFYTIGFDLGELDWSRTDHEIGNALGYKLIDGSTHGILTSRDPLASENVEINESQWDMSAMPLWAKLTQHHYDTTDTDGRLIDYTMTSNLQE